MTTPAQRARDAALLLRAIFPDYAPEDATLPVGAGGLRVSKAEVEALAQKLEEVTDA